MESLCCLGKIFYYVGLILYMGCDSFFDWWNWWNYSSLCADKEEFKVNNFLLLFSFFVGLVINIFMLWVYGHYIKFHCDCFLDDDSEGLYKDHLRFNWLELCLSVLELVFKDDIQSAIVFRIYASQLYLTGSRPGWYFVVFSVCSIFAHFKRCVRLITKLCGCGEGEEDARDHSCIYLTACVAGLLASAWFLLFTVLSLLICYDGKSCIL